MEKKQSYIVPETEIVSLHTLGAIAINPADHGENNNPGGVQYTKSFEGFQGAKEFTLDEGDFNFEEGGVGEWSSDWSSEWKTAEE